VKHLGKNRKDYIDTYFVTNDYKHGIWSMVDALCVEAGKTTLVCAIEYALTEPLEIIIWNNINDFIFMNLEIVLDTWVAYFEI